MILAKALATFNKNADVLASSSECISNKTTPASIYWSVTR
ncbi:hypothetical protein EDB74_10186 [Vibrio crassostreae]|nr:hypothetical protein EDB74_10186 [Vibrio crassostreae]